MSDPTTFTPLIIVHVNAALIALLLGLFIFTNRTGTRFHRFLGIFWSISMMITAATSFGIGDGFSWIHILSAVTLTTIPIGILCIYNRYTNLHAFFMIGNYVGLWAAAIPAFLTDGRLMNSITIGLF